MLPFDVAATTAIPHSRFSTAGSRLPPAADSAAEADPLEADPLEAGPLEAGWVEALSLTVDWVATGWLEISWLETGWLETTIDRADVVRVVAHPATHRAMATPTRPARERIAAPSITAVRRGNPPPGSVI